jgi:hypothetical protein
MAICCISECCGNPQGKPTLFLTVVLDLVRLLVDEDILNRIAIARCSRGNLRRRFDRGRGAATRKRSIHS